jgi:GNAT superfamily N-acetyltransferase
MSTEDLPFAVRITDEKGWGLTEEDFRFMMELEPKGCFVLFQGSERIGIATNISFSRMAWFGNLIVSERHRNVGAGSLLVKHSLKYLIGKGVETVGLYAYLDKIPFYKRLGFEYDSDFIAMKGEAFSSTPKTSSRQAGKENVQEIINYDNVCFGASRRKMLEPILLDSDNLCYESSEDGQILGYAVAKVYRGRAELGPLVCQRGRTDVALDLLTATLNRLKRLEVSLCIPEKESQIIKMLMESGFTENFRVARMFHGPRIVDKCIYLAESLERG